MAASLQLIAQSMQRMADGSPPPEGPAPAFRLEFAGKENTYFLRNVGTGRATGVTASLGDFPMGMTRNVPDGTVDLAPMEATAPILIAATWQHPVPGQLRVTATELEEPLVVPIP